MRTGQGVACVCGHPFEAHQHYRAGTECVICAPRECARFRRTRWWRRWTAGRAV
ncbi:MULTISPECIES: hypothetical protein [unclassified Actinoplanes]|uniref:hypothetical protein n=1 Tax=unclassified Actinoplanes TaxID=2626549 RepID=UPI0009C1C7AE|nr:MULTISPECIES: hypothetical protein [unclassified Actinoplanes]SLL99471.1 hypothetical protein ACSP50_2702 [Actinoplanes sp. SE50/110]